MQLPHLSVTKLALGNLKTRKKQYILLILGIVLSIAFSASVLFFSAAFNQNVQRKREERIGHQNFVIFDSENVDISLMQLLDPTLVCVYAENIGFAYTAPEQREYGMAIAVGNDAWREMSGQELSEGRMPADENEIAVERAALVYMQSAAEVGDTLSLLVDVPDGQGGYVETVEKTYTLVGILADKRKGLRQDSTYETGAYRDFPAAFVTDGTQVSPGGKAVRLAYGQGKEWNDEMYRQYYEIHPDHEFYRATFYQEYNVIHNTADREGLDSLNIGYYLSYFLIAASVFGVVSAFNMNLQERRRQIGLLRAVGTTKKQIVNIFGREALVIALCGVPAGLGISYLAVYLILRALDEDFVFTPSPLILLLAALFGMAVVMLAALIPLFYAARISPMQALRNTDLSVKMKRRKIKGQNAFRVPKLLASREIKFHGFKNTGVALFLGLGIMVSIFAPTLIGDQVSGSFRMPYDFYAMAFSTYPITWVNMEDNRQWFSESDPLLMKNNENVREVVTARECMLAVDNGKMTPYMREITLYSALGLPDADNRKQHTAEQDELVVLDEMKPLLEQYELPDTAFAYYMLVLEEDVVEEILSECDENKTTLTELNAGKSVIALAPEGFLLNFTNDGHASGQSLTERTDPYSIENADLILRRDSLLVGEQLNLYYLSAAYENWNDAGPMENLPLTERLTHQVEIGAQINRLDAEIAENLFRSNTALITTPAGAKAMGFPVHITGMKVKLNDRTDIAAQEEVHNLLSECTERVSNPILQSTFESTQEIAESYKELVMAITALLVMFFIIISATLCNITNAKVRESRRMIGTLRAVGADAGQLRKVYIYQLGTIFAVGGGIGFGSVVVFKIYTFIYEKVIGAAFDINDLTLWVSVVLTLALAGVCAP